MKDFDKQLHRFGDELNDVRYPYSEAELDREIRRVIWNTEQDDNTLTEQKSATTQRKLWPAAAAACVAALLLPLVMHTVATDLHPGATESFKTVNVDGESVFFACNSGCSPDATIETFKTLIK